MSPSVKAILDLLPEPCLIAARDGTVVLANRSAERAFGFIPESRLQEFVEDIAATERYLASGLRSPSPLPGAMRIRDLAGEMQDIRAEASLYRADGNHYAFIRLTAKKEASREFVSLNERLGRLQGEIQRRQIAELKLARKNEELAQADSNKDRFLAILSHELRNPLSPIMNVLHILKYAPEVQRGPLIEMASRHVSHLVRLLNDLLDVSRVTTGKLQLRFEEVDVAEVIRDAVSGVQPKTELAEQRVHLEIDGLLRVIGDPDRLRQVVANLLDNASKFSPKGSLVAVCARLEPGEVVVLVSDSGPGIPEGLRSKIFTLFFQGPRAQGEGGLGLGLALSKALIESHGGTIELDADAAGGTTFRVRLPAVATNQVPTPSSLVQ